MKQVVGSVYLLGSRCSKRVDEVGEHWTLTEQCISIIYWALDPWRARKLPIVTLCPHHQHSLCETAIKINISNIYQFKLWGQEYDKSKIATFSLWLIIMCWTCQCNFVLRPTKLSIRSIPCPFWFSFSLSVASDWLCLSRLTFWLPTHCSMSKYYIIGPVFLL